MDFASDKEVQYANKVLLKEEESFDDSRVKIIKANDSRYIQACPGSGKTTVLLAKLIILANKMPLSNGKGICVITHTNVAIDEIKAKLGEKADILFHYPNFFGTIQSFLHKYITSQALFHYYKSKIEFVDDKIANQLLAKKFFSLEFKNCLKGFIYAHSINKINKITFKKIREIGRLDFLLNSKVISVTQTKKNKKYKFNISGYDKVSLKENGLSDNEIHKILEYKSELKTKLKIQEEDIIVNTKIDFINKNISISDTKISFHSPSGQEFMKIKEELFKEGILTYDDAYKLAFRYIKDLNIDFKSISSNRFMYLFIDEMQDCDKQQYILLNQVFDENRVIVQRFGDYCQAIFEQPEEELDNLELKKIYKINNSLRFGESIAKVLRTICMEDNADLQGNINIPSVKPKLILFDNPSNVLPKFTELLVNTRIPEMGNRSILEIANYKREIDPLHRINIKACGWRSDTDNHSSKLCIKSYFPSFEKEIAKQDTDKDTFDSYLKLNIKYTPKDYANSIISGIIKFLYLSNITNNGKRFNVNSLLDFFQNKSPNIKNEFLGKVMEWVIQLSNKNPENKSFYDIKSDIYKYITGHLLPIFKVSKIQDNSKIFFLEESKIQKSENKLCNVYSKNNVDVEISTVHSIKGETHVATLYLETYYKKKHDSERVHEQFKGQPYNGNDRDSISNLRVLYVGMSRPRYLLCLAIDKKHFKNIDSIYLQNTWDIVEC